MRWIRFGSAALALLGAPVGLGAQEGPHHLAEDLAPSQHHGISKARAAALDHIGCMITQFADTPKLDGVVMGALRAAGSKDLAVLCHHDNREVVVVFWGNSPTIGDSLFSQAHEPQGELYLASPAYIVEHIAWYGTEVPELPHGEDSPAYRQQLRRIITHAGLGLTVGECCSSVSFLMGRRWVGLPGAD